MRCTQQIAPQSSKSYYHTVYTYFLSSSSPSNDICFRFKPTIVQSQNKQSHESSIDHRNRKKKKKVRESLLYISFICRKEKLLFWCTGDCIRHCSTFSDSDLCGRFVFCGARRFDPHRPEYGLARFFRALTSPTRKRRRGRGGLGPHSRPAEQVVPHRQQWWTTRKSAAAAGGLLLLLHTTTENDS